MFDISNPQADAVRRAAALTDDDYRRLYRQSVEHPDTFWAEQAKRLTGSSPGQACSNAT
jgi:acetyl-CoA synthetase